MRKAASSVESGLQFTQELVCAFSVQEAKTTFLISRFVFEMWEAGQSLWTASSCPKSAHFCSLDYEKGT